MRWRSGATGVALLAVLVTLAGCGGNGNVEAFATSGPETGAVLVHGVIKNDGKPLSGAQIGLTLFPEDNDAPAGPIDTYDPKPVVTGSDGRFALRLDPEKLTSEYYNGDFLNYDINVFSDDKMGSWSSTVYLIDERVWRSAERARIADNALKMNFDLGKQTIVTTDSLGERETTEWLVSSMRG